MLGAQLNGQGKRYEVEGIRVLTLGPLNLLYPLLGTHHVAGSLSSFRSSKFSLIPLLSLCTCVSRHMKCDQRTILGVILRNTVPLSLRENLSPRSEADQWGQIGCPASSQDLSASTSKQRGRQACATTSGVFTRAPVFMHSRQVLC